MDEQRTDTLTERIECLERENRRLKRVGAVALAGSIALLILGAKGADGPKVVEAERFVLRDQEGRERGWWGVNKSGTASLGVEDKEGQGGVSLIAPVDGSNPYVEIWNRKQGYVHLNVGKDRLGLDILDKDRKGLMSLKIEDVNGDRTQYLSLLEGAGQVNLGLHKDGSGGLAIIKHADKRRTELWQQADGGPVLRIYNQEGKPVVQIPSP